jgi:hypothetical protein
MLARLGTAADVAMLLPSIGFGEAAVPLDGEARRQLGIHPVGRTALIARGSGALRALVVEAAAGVTAREAARQLSARLSSGSPHILWLLLVIGPAARELAIAAWARDESRLRTAALIVELDHVLDSDAETLCTLAAVRDSTDVTAHGRWVELLGRDALTRRFYRALEQTVRGMSDSITGVPLADDRDEISLLHVSRFLFLSFLEAKGWLDGDRGFLMRVFNDCMSRGAGSCSGVGPSGGGNTFFRRVAEPLIFGTLNTPHRDRSATARAFGALPFLNGGLFSRTRVERGRRNMRIPDDAFGALFGGLLSRYRFTAREDSSSWSEAAIDPEMMGKAFESLMNRRSRHGSGAFYTPQVMVEHVTHAALVHAISADGGVTEDQVDAALRGTLAGVRTSQRLLARLRSLRLLDPACGSGAFLVHALERIADLRAGAGDTGSVVELRRQVLCSSIFGVDVNPTAVWLCEMRLWLSIVIDSQEANPLAVNPLPNLDHNIRVGDSLGGGGLREYAQSTRSADSGEVLRQRYMRATGRRKTQLARALDAVERKHALYVLSLQQTAVSAKRRDIIAAQRSRDLFGERKHRRDSRVPVLDELREKARELRDARLRIRRGGAMQFSFASHFPEAAANGGFDIVLGNPPWVRLERIPAEQRTLLRRSFDVFRLPAWNPAPADTRAPMMFGPQVDMAALFVERSISLSAPHGTTALVLPAKLWRSLAGSGVRQYIEKQTEVREIEDWAESPSVFDAVVYPSVLVLRRKYSDVPSPAVVSVLSRGSTLRWSMPWNDVLLDSTPGAPWVLVPAEVRAAFNEVRSAGIPMREAPVGLPRLGVKCGFNSAFLVRLQGVAGDVATIRGGSRTARIESTLLRPLLRGEGVQRWSYGTATEQIIWTHGRDGLALAALPPLARRWFLQQRHELSRRTDLQEQGRWWALFRTEAARNDKWRVVWPDIAQVPRASVLAPGHAAVPLNSCYVSMSSSEEDANTLAALLNSQLCAAWLNILAEQARGGYRRYLAWTISLLPMPSDWSAARRILAPLAHRAVHGSDLSEDELLCAVLRAYGLRHETVAPLLTWANR